MPRKHIHRQVVLAVSAATVVTSVVAFSLPRDFSVGNFIDDAHYAVLAKSIREERTYRTLNLPHQPRETKYPPVFPALLALFWSSERTGLENLDRLRWVNLAMVGPTAGALTLLGTASMGLNPWTSAALAVAGLMAPRTVRIWTVPLSSLLFLFCLSIGLLLLPRSPPGWRLVVLSLTVHVRTIAVAFAVAAVAVHWYRKESGWAKDALVLGAVIAPWLLWQLVNRGSVPDELLGIYGSYGTWYIQSLLADAFTLLGRVPVLNLRDILLEFGFGFIGRGWVPTVVAGAIGLIAAWRIAAANGVDKVILVGLVLYALIMIAWPFPPDRFVAGVWPIVLLVVAASFVRKAWIVAVAAMMLSGFTLLRGDAVQVHQRRSAQVAEIAAVADTTIQRTDIVASTNAGLYYLRYGTPSVPGQRMRTYRRYRLGYWSTAWGLGDDVWDIVRRYRVTKAIVEPRGVEGRYAIGSLMGQCPQTVTKFWESDSGAMMFSVNSNAVCEPRRPTP